MLELIKCGWIIMLSVKKKASCYRERAAIWIFKSFLRILARVEWKVGEHFPISDIIPVSFWHGSSKPVRLITYGIFFQFSRWYITWQYEKNMPAIQVERIPEDSPCSLYSLIYSEWQWQWNLMLFIGIGQPLCTWIWLFFLSNLWLFAFIWCLSSKALKAISAS